MRDLTEAEKNYYIKEKLEEVFEKYQKNSSAQNVHTPKDLIDEIISKIGTFNNKDVLVIANYDMLKYIVWLNSEGRANYKSITFLTDIAEETLPSKDRTMYEIVVANLSEPDTIDMMGKQFDIVIGNPPYQPQRDTDADYPLWLDFTTLSISVVKDNGKVLLITPPKFIGQSKPTSSRAKVNYSVFLDNNVEFIKVLTPQEITKHFSGVGSKFCYYIISKGEPKSTDVNIGDKNFKIDLSSTIPAPNDINDLTSKLFIKLSSMDKFTFNDDYSCHSQKYKKGNWSESETNTCNVPIVVSHKITRYTDFKQKLYNQPKILVPAVSTINKSLFSQNSNFGEDMKYMLVDDEEHANNVLSLLHSKLYKYIGSNFRPGRNLDKVARNIFPKLDTSKKWTDEELYAHFDLTQEEIDLIEKSV